MHFENEIICLPVCPFIPSIIHLTHSYLLIYLLKHLSIHQFIYPSKICPAIQSIHPSVLIHSFQCSICLSIHMLFHVTACLSIYPSIHSFIFIPSVRPYAVSCDWLFICPSIHSLIHIFSVCPYICCSM